MPLRWGTWYGVEYLPLGDFLLSHLHWTQRLSSVNGFLVTQGGLFFVFTKHYLSDTRFKFLFRCFLKHDYEFSQMAKLFNLDSSWFPYQYQVAVQCLIYFKKMNKNKRKSMFLKWDENVEHLRNGLSRPIIQNTDTSIFPTPIIYLLDHLQ